MKQLIIFIFLCTFIRFQVSSQQVEVIYKTYCGGCHGARMEGNSAPALNKEKWKHGSSYAAIFKSIKTGIPKTEMRGWANVIKEKDIAALANYIVSSQKKPVGKAPGLPSQIVAQDYILKVQKLDSGHTSTPW